MCHTFYYLWIEKQLLHNPWSKSLSNLKNWPVQYQNNMPDLYFIFLLSRTQWSEQNDSALFKTLNAVMSVQGLDLPQTVGKPAITDVRWLLLPVLLGAVTWDLIKSCETIWGCLDSGNLYIWPAVDIAEWGVATQKWLHLTCVCKSFKYLFSRSKGLLTTEEKRVSTAILRTCSKNALWQKISLSFFIVLP